MGVRPNRRDGHRNMDQYADDLAELTAHLNLKDAVHVGHSTGGGEVARYIGRHGDAAGGKSGVNWRGDAHHDQDRL